MDDPTYDEIASHRLGTLIAEAIARQQPYVADQLRTALDNGDVTLRVEGNGKKEWIIVRLDGRDLVAVPRRILEKDPT